MTNSRLLINQLNDNGVAMPHLGKPSAACKTCKQRHIRVSPVTPLLYRLFNLKIMYHSAMKRARAATDASKPTAHVQATPRVWTSFYAIRIMLRKRVLGDEKRLLGKPDLRLKRHAVNLEMT